MNHRIDLRLASLSLFLFAAITGCPPPDLKTIDGGAMDGQTDGHGDGFGDGRDGSDAGCPAGQMRCTGACVDLQSSDTNCGTCGMPCPTGQHCMAGACTLPCGTGMTACGSSPLMTCVDLNSDSMNCGMCGNACAGGTSCVLGSCLCPARQSLCSGTCADLQSDPMNCGMCGNACPSGQVCIGGGCTTGCASPAVTCTSPITLGAVCTNTSFDGTNCGSCGNICLSGFGCSSGSCTCAAGNTVCSSGCVNLSFDPGNCGGCGHVCAPGSSCSSGVCSCSGTMCGGNCVQLPSDANNCGSCGHRCPAGAFCNSGTCTCPGGTLLCGTECSNTMTDPGNCGTCGTACNASQRCVMGVCMTAPSGHYAMGVSSATFVNACGLAGAVRVLRGVDDGLTIPIALPFPFLFYGAPYNQARPSSNGYLLLGAGGLPTDNTYAALGPLPDDRRAHPAIFALGGDLMQRIGVGGGICVASDGTMPNRRFIVETSDAHQFPGSDADAAHLTFEIILNEADNSIDLLYQTLIWGNQSRAFNVGLQDQNAERALSIEYGNAPLMTVTNGTAIHLTYVP